mmetsp:Transcript_53001/g.115655  ORF Transcript_53001/g.115655 Transcript_53001/m.115655 type:complete len:243 (-) Transcript_53001:763-1491(-)
MDQSACKALPQRSNRRGRAGGKKQTEALYACEPCPADALATENTAGTAVATNVAMEHQNMLLAALSISDCAAADQACESVPSVINPEGALQQGLQSSQESQPHANGQNYVQNEVQSQTQSSMRAEVGQVGHGPAQGTGQADGDCSPAQLPTTPDDWLTVDQRVCYEYLDHTADVQLHAWGDSLERAFEQMVLCVMGVLTDLHTVDVDGAQTREVNAEGHDLHSLLYNFLDEWLFQARARAVS